MAVPVVRVHLVAAKPTTHEISSEVSQGTPVEQETQEIAARSVSDGLETAANVVAEEKIEDNEIDVPNGTPEEMLALIRQKTSGLVTTPQRQNQEEVVAYVKLFKEFKTIAEKGLAGNPTSKVRSDLLRQKAWAYALATDYEPGLYPEYEAFVNEVEANPNDREAAMNIRGRFLEFQGNRFWRGNITEKEFLNHRKAVLEFLENKDAESYLSLLGTSLVSHALKVTDQTKDREIAIETAALVKDLYLNLSNETDRKRQSDWLDATLRSHWIKEDGLDAKGILPDGKEFDIASFRGKTVLLILWSNNQVPFSQGKTNLEVILPHITELYENITLRGLKSLISASTRE